MWMFASSSFFSVVADESNPKNLLVRTRFAPDIRRVFPNAAVRTTPESDYRYRASIPRAEVAAAVAAAVAAIDYPNFKNTVTEPYRAAAYGDVWLTMHGAQQDRARRRARSGRAALTAVTWYLTQKGERR